MADETPQYKKRTPGNEPGLLEQWQEEFADLRKDYVAYRAMGVMAERYGVSTGTIHYWLFPERRKQASEIIRRYWETLKADPDEYKRATDRTKRYRRIIRGIDQVVKDAFEDTGENKLTLDQIRDYIRDREGFDLQIGTIIGNVRKYEQKDGTKLLIESKDHKETSFYELAH